MGAERGLNSTVAGEVDVVMSDASKTGGYDDTARCLETNLVKLGSIPAQVMVYGRPFPLVLQPREKVCNFFQLQEYMREKHAEIQNAASEYGVVWFAGFEVKSPEEWASVLSNTGLKEMPYIGGAAVRKLIVGNEKRLTDMNVVTTNESPPSEAIPFHCELAQTPNPPDHISFWCKVNTTEGGATPVLRTDLVYNFLLDHYPEALQNFESLGVKYVRIVPEEDDFTSAQGRSYKSMFKANSREEAEKEMAKDGWNWEWQPNGDCKTISKCLPAVRTTASGKKVFCNQVIAAYFGWVDKRNEMRKSCVFGNGEPLPAAVMDDLKQFMDDNAVACRWHPGDFMLIDNYMAYHSRQTFSTDGRRKVMASIAKGTKDVKSKCHHLTLSSGDRMPSVGLGTWKIPKDKTAESVYSAITNGYRLIDEACDYGNEVEAGQGINQAISEGIVSRDDLFITSKLWNTYHRKEHVKAACLKTLKDLSVEYLDLYLIHFPISLKFVPFEKRYPPEWIYDPESADKCMVEDAVPMRETWEAMQELVEEGLVRNIGLCNVGVSMIRDILSYAKIKPAVLQVEIHPYNSQQVLLRYCRENGIAITAFSNLGASSYLELNMSTKADSCLEEECVRKLAEKHGKTPAQIVLRWGVQRGTAIIPKSSKTHRLVENISLFDFNLSNDDMMVIDSLNANKRFNDPGVFAEGAFNTFFPIYE
eukprot:CAMPEP_0204830648 /NCGR_PEP_ID=MMETSP1346-20131115/9039_1 /ASSEMBLY_ACC=CAM_ASM_000771 /TAXON_ID=215587 /ORGANISM="Aplanochytrium stocchinoi, Strain GSBS06" /LENGTH=701 /DNA_ID=CAMNT_0051961101 /DNA_START=131 /DNA_END=2236 /DNA_ORIENTATION=+